MGLCPKPRPRRKAEGLLCNRPWTKGFGCSAGYQGSPASPSMNGQKLPALDIHGTVVAKA